MTNGPESAPRRSRRAADVPVDSPAGQRERVSLQRARDREALRASKALAEAPERRDSETVQPTRRQLRLQQQRAAAAGGIKALTEPLTDDPAVASAAPDPAAAELSAPGSASATPDSGLRRERRRHSLGDSLRASSPAADTDPNADVAGMSVEQALAARQALEGQARNHVAAMEAVQVEDPEAVDQELLAQQKALAERARVLNSRTQAIEKLTQEHGQSRPVPNDPAAASNLAMVTPLEFVQVPGMEHPVMKAPPTSHIPIVTPSMQRVAPEAAPARRRAAAGSTDIRRSRILARPDATAATPGAEEAASPIGARSAFGLDPLDVMTAGLGRTRRLRFAVFGVAGLGAFALIVGLLMIVGGLGG